MGRRIYIIPTTMRVEDALEAARANNCPEIAIGIPPRVRKQSGDVSLPCVYEEPDEPEPEFEPGPIYMTQFEEVVANLETQIGDVSDTVSKLDDRVKELEGVSGPTLVPTSGPP